MSYKINYNFYLFKYCIILFNKLDLILNYNKSIYFEK
jgi:hypothetical protein